MVEEFRKAPVENMDEVIYCVNGTYRLLEFLVSHTYAQYTVLLGIKRRQRATKARAAQTSDTLTASAALRYLYITVADFLLPGCGVCGMLRRIRDSIRGVERDGQHDHPGPLVL